MSGRLDMNTMPLSKDAKTEDVQKLYDQLARQYDEDMIPGSSYPSVCSTIKTFVEAVGKDGDKNMRIIDLGAGTGYAAVELKKNGFENIDGLDLSPEMLKKAKEKNVYKNYICAAVTEKPLDIKTGTYDAVISTGAITSGYIKVNAFDEILRLVKPGGYIAFTLRQDVLDQDDYGYSQRFEQYVNEGKWQQVKKYLTDYIVGYADIMKKCYVLCYKVLKN